MAGEWTVEFYAEEDGSEPVADFLRDADLTAGELKQIGTRLQYLRQSGLTLLGTRADVLETLVDERGLYALRCPNTPNNPRILLCAVVERRFVLLHGFKEQNSTDYSSAIQIAQRRKRRIEEIETTKRNAERPDPKKTGTKKKGKRHE